MFLSNCEGHLDRMASLTWECGYNSTIAGVDFLEFRPSEIAASVALSALKEIQFLEIDKALACCCIHVNKVRVVHLLRSASLSKCYLRQKTSVFCNGFRREFWGVMKWFKRWHWWRTGHMPVHQFPLCQRARSGCWMLHVWAIRAMTQQLGHMQTATIPLQLPRGGNQTEHQLHERRRHRLWCSSLW